MVRFGSADSLAFDVRPLSPTWDRSYAPERTAWAALSIWVGGLNLCEHVEEVGKPIHEAVNIPLAGLADWLVRAWPSIRFEERAPLFAASEEPHANVKRWGESAPPTGLTEEDWLDQREDWWKRHFLIAGTDDIYLPNLAFARQENTLIIEWRPRFRPGGQPNWLREGGVRTLQWSAAEDAASAFVAYVAAWLRREGLTDLYAWVGYEDPLRALKLDPQRALELYVGRSAAELSFVFDIQDVQGIRQRLGLTANAEDPAASPVTQALRDLPPGLPAGVREPLSWILDSTTSKRVTRLEDLRVTAQDVVRDSTSPEAAGYEAAAAIRKNLSLNGQPIASAELLLKDLGVEARTSNVSVPGAHMLAGFRAQHGAIAVVLQSDRTKFEWVRRFEYARALGHVLLDQTRADVLGAAFSTFSIGQRKRRAGAFAAELLLPSTALQRLSRGTLDEAAKPEVFLPMLKQYGIGASSAAHHLWNHRLLSSPSVRDDLIEEYAAQVQ